MATYDTSSFWKVFDERRCIALVESSTVALKMAVGFSKPLTVQDPQGIMYRLYKGSLTKV